MIVRQAIKSPGGEYDRNTTAENDLIHRFPVGRQVQGITLMINNTSTSDEVPAMIGSDIQNLHSIVSPNMLNGASVHIHRRNQPAGDGSLEV